MSNSSLVNCTVKSPNHSGKRTHRISRLTPHCVVGQLSAESIGGCFTSTSIQASCNYGIGYDGRICLIVDEACRSWCSSSNSNDQRAVTIECASDKTAPYAMSSAVYKSLVNLCVDICKRNGITKLLWLGSKEATLSYEPKANEAVLTAHRWFANKSCPGDWLYSRYGDLAKRVTASLGGAVTNHAETTSFPATPFTVEVKIPDLNYRSLPSMDGRVKGQTGKGVFTIISVSNGWGKLKSGAGWIYLGNSDYVTIGKAAPSAPHASTSSSYKVKITADVLNVRAGAGTNFKKVTTVKRGEVYTIVDTASNWGKLKSGAGWICLDYTARC